LHPSVYTVQRIFIIVYTDVHSDDQSEDTSTVTQTDEEKTDKTDKSPNFEETIQTEDEISLDDIMSDLSEV